MQIIKGTIKFYTTNSRKIDYILKRAYNENLDIRCVGAGIGNLGTPYILILSTKDLFMVLRDFNKISIEFSSFF